MPSLGSHLALAHLLAGRVAHRDLQADRGSFYLGATAPDIRVFTRADREHTHFFTLEELSSQDAVARLFATHPRLREAVSLDLATRAFMAGYLTHLLMDQLYIERVYRECFGSGTIYADDPRGNVLDRVLQFELDRRERERSDVMGEIREALACASVDAEVGFIERETLARWREVASDIAAQPPDWERFRRIAQRHLSNAGVEGDDAIAQFYRELPDVLRETLDHVTEARVHEFMDGTIDAATERLRDYLR